MEDDLSGVSDGDIISAHEQAVDVAGPTLRESCVFDVDLRQGLDRTRRRRFNRRRPGGCDGCFDSNRSRVSAEEIAAVPIIGALTAKQALELKVETGWKRGRGCLPAR